MSLHIYKNKNNTFNFAIAGVHNALKAHLFPELFSSYELASQAEFVGRKYLKFANTIKKFAESSESEEAIHVRSLDDKEHPFDTIIVNHYFAMLEDLNDKLNGINGDEEEKKKIYEELKIITGNLLQIQSSLKDEEKQEIKDLISKFGQFARKNFQKYLDQDLSQKKSSIEKYRMVMSQKIDNFEHNPNILEEIGMEICQAIKLARKDAIYIIDKKQNKITIASCLNPIKYLNVSLDNNLQIKNIFSLDPFCKNNDFSFYQNYLKPISEKLNNIVVANKKINNVYLPDLPNKNKKVSIMTEEGQLTFDFQADKKTWKSYWTEKQSSLISSRLTEEDLINAKLIKCIDDNLSTIYDKTGTLVQVLPLKDHIEVDVDFGNQVVRLAESQIKIINDI